MEMHHKYLQSDPGVIVFMVPPLTDETSDDQQTILSLFSDSPEVSRHQNRAAKTASKRETFCLYTMKLKGETEKELSL